MNKYSDLSLRPFTSKSTKNLFGSSRSFLSNRPTTTGFPNLNDPHSKSTKNLNLGSTSYEQTWDSLYSPRSAVQETTKSIDDSQYQITVNFPLRPKTSSLSGLTLQENERVMHSARTLLSHRSYANAPVFTESNMKLPDERAFTRILNKIEMIVSNKYMAHRGSTLRDGEPIEIMAEANSFSYLKIMTRGKRCPLRVHLKRVKGRVVTYVSRMNPEPSQALHDSVHKIDYFEVSDPGLKFKSDSVHFGIEAIEDSTFHVTVNFGRLKVNLNNQRKLNKQETYIEVDNIRKNEIMQYELSKRVEDAIARRKLDLIKNSNNKDFLKLNMNVVVPNSIDFIKDRKIMTQRIETRRKEAKVKNQMALKEKQLRAVNVINKQLIRAEEEKKERIRKEQLVVLQKEQREWLIVIFLAKSVVALKDTRNALREERFEGLRRSSSARKIQKFYRSHSGHKSISESSISRAKDLILFSFHHHKPFLMQSLKVQLLKCIHESARNHTLPHHFSAFQNRIFMVQKM